MVNHIDKVKYQYNELTDSNLVSDLFFLIGCVLNGVIPDVANKESSILYELSERHSLTETVAYVLELAGIQDAQFIRARIKAIQQTAQMDKDMAAVLEQLEEAGIWYMPLKSAVLKDQYPSFGIRQMADRDILFAAERAENVRNIMTGLVFTTEDYGNEYGYHLSPKDFYVYMVFHAFKHYSKWGTGLRTILDTYVQLKNVKIDLDYVAEECKKLGISEFEATNRSLALLLFGGEELSENERRMLNYAVSSGT